LVLLLELRTSKAAKQSDHPLIKLLTQIQGMTNTRSKVLSIPLIPSKKRQDIEEEGLKPSFISFMIRGLRLDLRDTSNLEDDQSDARGSLSFLIRGGYGLDSLFFQDWIL
jgi:hypothetical protein